MSHKLLGPDVSKFWELLHLGDEGAHALYVVCAAEQMDFLFEEYAQRSFYEPDYPADAYLVFGRETKGLPPEIVEPHRDQMVSLPMRSDKVRSLNLANTVAAAAYQAVRPHI